MTYVTDISKLLQSPILHVYGNDPIAFYRAIKLAMKWKANLKPIFSLILFPSGKWGHNEIDEPSFTQPKMYEIIKNHPGTFAKFNKEVSEIIDEKTKGKIKKEYIEYLNQSLKKYEDDNIKVYFQTLTDQWKELKKLIWKVILI